MKRNSLQMRFFLAYLLVIVCIIAFVTLFLARYTSDVLISRETDAQLDQLGAVMAQTEGVIDNMDNVSVTIGYSSILKSLLGESFDLDVASADFQTISQVIVAINGAEMQVDQIYLYDFSGSRLGVGFTTNTAAVDITESPYYTDIMALAGGKLVTGPYYSANFSSNVGQGDWCISVYRVYHNRYGRLTGIIETTRRCPNIFKYMRVFAMEDGREAYIYGPDGTLVYPYDPAQAGQPQEDYLALLQTGANHLTHTAPTGERQLIAYDTSASTGWTYVAVQSLDVTLAPVRNFYRYLLVGIGLFTVLAVVISFYLSRGLTKPIHQLGAIIRDTGIETLGRQGADKLAAPFIEFSELTQSYQDMSVKLKQALDETLEARQQEMKSRSLALQSQINPHFYYNTLSSVLVLAENGQTDEIAALCRNLTSIMRYITNSGTQLVTLGQEMDYVNKYLYCMKVRYQDSLQYTVDIHDELLHVEVPKLIIQPLVENALKYGTHSIPPWQISIKSHMGEAGWYIEVVDSGPGFTAEAMELMAQRITHTQQNMGMPDIAIEGMGLLNVYTRWHLHCQGRALFEYGNTEEGHGRVAIGRQAEAGESQGET